MAISDIPSINEKGIPFGDARQTAFESVQYMLYYCKYGKFVEFLEKLEFVLFIADDVFLSQVEHYMRLNIIGELHPLSQLKKDCNL